jgi:hypothetical protein
LGLDTFALARRDTGEWRIAPDEPFEGLRLCDGWGASSIRGKVYADVVAAATGESLYSERIEPATVADMAGRFRAAVERARRSGERVGERSVRDLDEHGAARTRQVQIRVLVVAGCEMHAGEAEDLARWLEVCARCGYAIEGWW